MGSKGERSDGWEAMSELRKVITVMLVLYMGMTDRI